MADRKAVQSIVGIINTVLQGEYELEACVTEQGDIAIVATSVYGVRALLAKYDNTLVTIPAREITHNIKMQCMAYNMACGIFLDDDDYYNHVDIDIDDAEDTLLCAADNIDGVLRYGYTLPRISDEGVKRDEYFDVSREIAINHKSCVDAIPN